SGAAQRGDFPGVQDVYRKAYLAQLEDTDEYIGKIVDMLAPWRDQTAIVVTADHGQLLGEHGFFGHGHWAWAPLPHIPFVAVNAGALPDDLSNAALADVVTSAVGVAHDWPVHKDDGFPLVSQREGKVALTTDGHTVGIWQEDRLDVFDLATDPDEL